MAPKQRSYKWEATSVDPSTDFAFCLKGHPPLESPLVTLGDEGKKEPTKKELKEARDGKSEKASTKASVEAAPEPDRALPGVGLGTFEMNDEVAFDAVARALMLGYRHIDTADSYNNEGGIGRAIAMSNIPRAEVFVTTKLWPGNPAWGQETKTEEQVIDACKGSLKRLGLKYIDLYLIHGPFSGSTEARLAQYRGMLECKRLGLTKAVGVANYSASHLAEILDADLPPPQANQLELHPLCQRRHLREFMWTHKILPIAYSSLAPLPEWRQSGETALYDQWPGAKTPTQKAKGTPPVISELASKHRKTEAQILLRFAYQSGWPTLPKSTRPDRMAANFDLRGFTLNDQEMKELEALEAGSVFAFGKPGKPMDPLEIA